MLPATVAWLFRKSILNQLGARVSLEARAELIEDLIIAGSNALLAEDEEREE